MNKIYLDAPPMFEMKYSSRKNRILSLLYFAFLSIFLVVVIGNIIHGHPVFSLLWLLYGTALVVIIISRFVTQKKYGRRYVGLSESALEIKHTYSQKPEHVPWNEIEEIIFQSCSFIVVGSPGQIKFKAPIDKYLDLRESIRQYAETNSVIITG